MIEIKEICESCQVFRILAKLSRAVNRTGNTYECLYCGLEQEIDTDPEEIT